MESVHQDSPDHLPLGRARSLALTLAFLSLLLGALLLVLLAWPPPEAHLDLEKEVAALGLTSSGLRPPGGGEGPPWLPGVVLPPSPCLPSQEPLSLPLLGVPR